MKAADRRDNRDRHSLSQRKGPQCYQNYSKYLNKFVREASAILRRNPYFRLSRSWRDTCLEQNVINTCLDADPILIQQMHESMALSTFCRLLFSYPDTTIILSHRIPPDGVIGPASRVLQCRMWGPLPAGESVNIPNSNRLISRYCCILINSFKREEMDLGQQASPYVRL